MLQLKHALIYFSRLKSWYTNSREILWSAGQEWFLNGTHFLFMSISRISKFKIFSASTTIISWRKMPCFHMWSQIGFRAYSPTTLLTHMLAVRIFSIISKNSRINLFSCEIKYRFLYWSILNLSIILVNKTLCFFMSMSRISKFEMFSTASTIVSWRKVLRFHMTSKTAWMLCGPTTISTHFQTIWRSAIISKNSWINLLNLS